MPDRQSAASCILPQGDAEINSGKKTGPARQARPSLQKGATVTFLSMPCAALSITDEGDFVNTRLTELDHTIQRTAHRLARQTGVDADEIAQEMYLAILEEARRKPDFLHQTDSYILYLAQWRAISVIRKNVTWDKYNALMPEVGDESTSVPLADLMPTPGLTPEEALSAGEEALEREAVTLLVKAVIPTLPQKYQVIAHGLMNGHKKKDIADTLGVKPQNISQYLHRMRPRFEQALASAGA